MLTKVSSVVSVGLKAIEIEVEVNVAEKGFWIGSWPDWPMSGYWWLMRE